VRHALSMQMATEWSEDLPYTDPRNSEIAMEMAADRYRYFLDRPMVGEPGGGWTYNGGATSVIAGLIAKGVGKPIDVYACETLFATLGIERFEWFVGSDADHQRDAQPDDAYHLLADRQARAFAAAFIEEFQHVISPGVRLLTAP